MKNAVMIGAGQIGRGFIGMLLEQAGYHVIFSDINRAVIDDINNRHEYTVHLVDSDSVETKVSNISGIYSDPPDLINAYTHCELICTSVGLTAFPAIAPAIATGIELRMLEGNQNTLNIIACENGIRATSKLKNLVYERLDGITKIFADQYIGFPDCAVDRIIPPVYNLAPAEVVVERYHEWDVEKAGFKGLIPEIPGMNIVDDLMSYVERKLFTLNGPNAVTGCLGFMKGYKTVKEALEDREIYNVVWGMMEECGRMLIMRHGFSNNEMLQYRTELMKRFLNPYIIDSVTRVAREPIRKLSPDDRIVAPMRYAHEYNIPTPNYYIGIASMLLYENADDAQSMKLQQMIKINGIKDVLRTLCNIQGQVSDRVESEYYRLKTKYKGAE